MEKVKVSQDKLYEYLKAHDVKLVRIAELMGKSLSVVSSCFLHHKDVHGKPRCFSVENIELLNKALPVIAEEMRGCLMTFGSPKTFKNSWGFTYDPALVEPMKRVGRYMSIGPLTERLLDWSRSKCKNTLNDLNGPVCGNIMEGDVMSINTELIAVAAVLEKYEVVPDEDAYDSSSSE